MDERKRSVRKQTTWKRITNTPLSADGTPYAILSGLVDLAALQDKMWAHGVHISVGALWQARCDDPEKLFRGADARMYEAKQAYYRRLAEVEG